MLRIKPVSILDTDLYKLTMQQAVLELFPESKAEYRFTNRGNQKFNEDFIKALKRAVKDFSELPRISDNELNWLKTNCPYLKTSYLIYLKNYRFNPEEVEIELENEQLKINIKGLWHRTILWEVPLMAMISEIYFMIFDKNWEGQINTKFIDRTRNKVKKLDENNCKYADFGTRRRLSFETQDKSVKQLKEGSGFIGTSNVLLAKKYGLKPIGTMAHEWIMGCSALEGLRNANYFALHNWVRVYNASLGIALTDTYGSESFFKNFNLRLSKLYDGVRHDSGDPIAFGQRVIEHYKSMNIAPNSKSIIFSDGLNVDKAINIQNEFSDQIKIAFGIGTHFTNDFDNVKPLNMVIKLRSVNGIDVVKLSDTPGKETGDTDAIKVAKWTFFNTPICKKEKSNLLDGLI